MKEKIKKFSDKYNVDTSLYQELDGVKIFGDINEIHLVDDGYGVDVEVFINGEITDHHYFKRGGNGQHIN